MITSDRLSALFQGLVMTFRCYAEHGIKSVR